MFFCDECAAKKDWPKSFHQSYGACEVCGLTGSCNDVPSGALPISPVKKLSSKEKQDESDQS